MFVQRALKKTDIIEYRKSGETIRLTGGGKVVNPTHTPHFTPQKHYFYVSGTHFC
jgi:hypothetical protein